MERTVIAGVGIHPFGRFESGYRELGAHAVREALADAGVSYGDVDFSFIANVGAEMAKGQNVMGLIGSSGKPIINVEAACGSSGSGMRLAAELIESGAADIVLCAGVEKAARGYVPASGYDRWQLETGLGVNPAYFGIVAQQLMQQTDVTVEDLADVSVKNHTHAVENPNAMYRKVFSREQVLDSTMVCAPLTLLMLCAPNEGAAAAVLMSEKEARRRGIEKPVRIRAVSLVSKLPTDDLLTPACSIVAEGITRVSARAAAEAYEAAGIGADDADLVECQDTDSAAELIAYRELGLCKLGEEAELLRSGATTLGGRIPVNPSGGLLSKGEPLGASGLGQVHELVTQIRGRAGNRQVENARVGIGHVVGAGYTASVTVLSN
jgi:acetyl-CoA acetyltransferase